MIVWKINKIKKERGVGFGARGGEEGPRPKKVWRSW